MKIIKQLCDFLEARKSFEDHKKKFEKQKEDFCNFLDKTMVGKTETVDFVEKQVTVTKVTPTDIIWNADALLNSGLDIEEAVIKTATIKDLDSFISYMKELGASPKKVKQMLIITKSVDDKYLNNLEAIGEISLEDLEGCYEVKRKKRYYKITEKEYDK